VAIVSPDEAEKILSAGPGGTILGTLVDAEGVRVKVRGE
jgi:phosphoribosylformylglycinamidine cyclo-ligase